MRCYISRKEPWLLKKFPITCLSTAWLPQVRWTKQWSLKCGRWANDPLASKRLRHYLMASWLSSADELKRSNGATDWTNTCTPENYSAQTSAKYTNRFVLMFVSVSIDRKLFSDKSENQQDRGKREFLSTKRVWRRSRRYREVFKFHPPAAR